ncbi:MAG: Crp/Fnr family transcriptional regulator [Vicinamibacteria bacterium]|nr:Crp/Fnr family transcriptional regulator [Vicinamibacteria bacterium]
MTPDTEALLRSCALFSRLSADDRRKVAEVSVARRYEKGDPIFSEGDASDLLFTIVSGRVKVVKAIPGGKELILEILGPGDPLGAIAAYEARPYPASAIALEPATCLAAKRAPFMALLETCPSLVRGMLGGFSLRVVELAKRLGEITGSRVEARFAQIFLKLGDRLGQPRGSGIFIPLALSRQDLADLAGTTMETSIRIMSRWGKERVVATEADGFVVSSREELESLGR